MLIIYGSIDASSYSWTASSVATLEGHTAKSDGYIVALYALLSSDRLVFSCKGDSITDRVIRQCFKEAVEVRVLITCSGTSAGSYPWTAGNITTFKECAAKSDRYIAVLYVVLLLGRLVFCCKGNSLTAEVFRSCSIGFRMPALLREV